MDLESSTSVEEVNLEGLHLDTDVIYKERLLSINGSKKRKTEESLDAQDLKCSNESNGCEETLKKRKRENPKPLQDSTILKQATDELDLMCKIWVMELRRLPLDQQLFARKAVCDVLFEARLGQLNKDSVRINRSDLVQNYLTCVHEEHGKVCACPNAWKPQQRCPTSSSQMYPGQPHCYSRAAWKGNLSSPHRPPFFATFAVNRFAAPATFHCPRGPRVGRPLVITTAISITTTTIVVVTPRLISATAPSASASNQVPTTGPSRMHSVNITPYRVENTENSASNVQTTRNLDTTVNNQDTTTHSSIPSNTENQVSELEQTVRSNNSTKPTVNTSTTPTINTLCDVRMDTVTTDN